MTATIATTYKAEITEVREAVTSFENAVEVYLTEDLDEQYEALADAVGPARNLALCAEAVAEALLKRARALEEING